MYIMSNQTQTVPKNFRSLVADFTRDLSTTFPEYTHVWNKWGNEDTTDDELETLFIFCGKVYPVNFFDILNQNEDIFKEGSDDDVYFLPNMCFKLIFNSEGLSQTSKKVIWKYLQLMLFTVVGTMDDKKSFGETASMFEGIDEGELQEKLQDAMKDITGLFAGMNTEFENNTPDTNEEDDDKSTDGDLPNMEGFKNMFKNMEGMPDLDNLQSSIKSMFDGKIGELAKEMAEEIADDFKDVLGDDIDTTADPKNILKKLMKNPAKISNLMKTVSTKLDAKMKDGSISKEELMKEASEMMSKMKDMGGEGGGENITEMFKNMAKSMGGMGKNMRFDQNAMNRMTKRESRVANMKIKADQQRAAKAEHKEAEFEKIRQRIKAQNEARQKCSITQTNDPNHLVFKIDGDGEQEKTFIHPELELIIQEEENEKANKLTSKKTKKKKKKSKK
mgnify:CR=1 FL=1|jgi:hypothetical protein